MSDREKEILSSIAGHVKKMDDEQRAYFDGVGAGMVITAGLKAGIEAGAKEEEEKK